MGKSHHKRMKKTTIARIILVAVIILCDIFLLPWILKLPAFIIKNLASAPADWFNYGVIQSMKDIITDSRFRNLYLFLQLPVSALILATVWDTNRLKKKNRIADGVGGPEPAGAGQMGTSRWQYSNEMDKTSNVWYTNAPIKKGGIIFGMERVRRKEKVWLNNDDLHTLIIGSTRSGKTRKIIIPSIWEIAKAGESMVISDPKGELYISLKEYLKKQGYNIIVLNLREPLKGNQWNLLDMVNKAVDDDNIPRATELAWDIAHIITNQVAAVNTEPIWKNGEESTIAAMILLSSMNSDFKFQRHMTTAYYLLAEYGQALKDESIPLMEYMKSLPVKHPAKAAFATASIAPYKTRASFYTAALANLRLFSDPNISDMTAKQDHSLESIGIDKTAVFLIIPDEKSTRNVLATLYIDQVYQSMVELANSRGGRIPRRVNFILDEFGNLPQIPEFDKKLTVAGGRGIRFNLAIQDVAQLKKLYDKNAQTITGNCHNWIYLKTADIETAKLISEKTGRYTVETENSSSSVQSKGHSLSHGVGLTGRPLLMTDEVLRWDTDESLVFPMSYFPARYPLPDLSFWSANNELGFIATGDIDKDKEANRQIMERRWNEVISRTIEEVQIWLPEIIIEKGPDEQSKTQPKSSDNGEHEAVDPEILNVENISLEDILKREGIKEAKKEEKEENFL